MDTSQITKTMQMRGFRFSHSEIENILTQNEAEYFYGAFSPLLSENVQ